MAKSVRQVQVRFDSDVHDRVCEIADATGESRNAVTLALLRRAIADVDRLADDHMVKALASTN